jgi:hypothetical protein
MNRIFKVQPNCGMRIADCRLRNETFSRYDYCIQFVVPSFIGGDYKESVGNKCRRYILILEKE